MPDSPIPGVAYLTPSESARDRARGVSATEGVYRKPPRPQVTSVGQSASPSDRVECGGTQWRDAECSGLTRFAASRIATRQLFVLVLQVLRRQYRAPTDLL